MAEHPPSTDAKRAFPKAGATFPEVARRMLLEGGLFPEQVQTLERMALPGIRSRIHRSPPMAAVREKLRDLEKHLNKLEILYLGLSMPKSAASAVAAQWLYVAQDAFEMPSDALSDSLERATKIVRRALSDLPKQQRRHRRGSGGFIGLILKALRLGHAQHFRCSGYGDEPSAEPMPPFEIEAGRKREPFVSIVQIVSEATGNWSVDEEIRDYLEAQATAQAGTRPKKNLT